MAKLRKTALLLFVAIWYSSSLCHARNQRKGNVTPSNQYLVVFPRVLISGASEVVCITLYQMAKPINITLELTVGDQVNQISYFMEFPHVCLDFMIPRISSPSVKGSLLITGRRYRHGRIIFAERKRIMVERSKRMTFVETDKPIYKPGQTMKFRVLTIDENLRPDNSAVDMIWVETPSGVRIAQWLSVEVTSGLASLELPMTSDPMFGTWNIFVKHHGEEIQRGFDVKEYVLPKFDVTIEGPSYLVVNETRVAYSICGRYTYGQPVIGTVRATLNPQLERSRRKLIPVVFEGETAGADGCVDAFFSISKWRLDENYYSIYDAKLRLEAEFTERATGVSIVEEDDKCDLTDTMFVLKFVGSQDYREGLPYTGKVLVTTPDGSPAARKRVHVEALHRLNFNIDLITDSHGCAFFELPAFDRASVVLRASLPGRPTKREEGKFTVTTGSARLSLRSHFSPSNTFLQVSDPTANFSIGEQVQLKVTHTSTQSLNRKDFTALFSSKGHIIRPEYMMNESRSTDLANLGYGVFDLIFTATSDMAPLTKVVVYSIQDGEVVADSTNVPVIKQSFENHVHMAFASGEGKPGDEIQLFVSASSASLCGVGVVDKSVYLLGGGSNNIQEEQVLQFLREFDLNGNIDIGSDKCWVQWQRGDRSYKRYRPRPAANDASVAFMEAGLKYLTNLAIETARCVTLRPSRPSKRHRSSNSIPSLHFTTATEVEPQSQPSPPSRIRSYFPETWLWDLVILSNTTRRALTLTVPDTITEWVSTGFCISETYGIGISSTSNLQAFQPFFVSYTLPYSVIRRETFPVQVTVFNYMTDCLMIELVLSESENFTLAAHEERIKQLCVCGSQSSSVEFEITPDMIGLMPIEVTATSISNGVIMCNNAVSLTGGNAADAIRQEILVEAEGIENEVAESVSFLPSESPSGFRWTVAITTPLNIVPDTAWAKVTLSGWSVVSSRTNSTRKTRNLKEMARSEVGLTEAMFMNSLSTNIQQNLNNGNELFDLKFTSNHKVMTTADKMDQNGGDVMVTTFSNIQSLVRMPYGCGEQNMLTFVPNVLAMQYLKATDQLTPEVAEEAVKNMKMGYQREFNYRHSDGSFSAFGENDESGSSWLTAYVVRSFYQASEFIEVDKDDLQHSISWLKSLQKLDGCFVSVGRLCHKDMLGGVNNDLTLSAYIIISLLEANADPLDSTIARGVACLEHHLPSTDDNYALSQIAYALALANSSKVHDVLQTLEDRAVYDDGRKHWTSNRHFLEGFARPKSLSSDVEMTAYVLMTYMVLYSRNEVFNYGLRVSEWLVQKRNARGGFGSTQDTVVGLTALSRFAKYSVNDALNISLIVESSQSQDWGMSKDFRVTNQNRLVLHQLYITDVPTTLNFEGSGEGMALLQVSIFYNTYPVVQERPEFELLVSAAHGSFPCSKYYVTVCVRYTGDDGASNMAVIDFRMQSGYVANKDSLEILIEMVPTLKRYEFDGKSVLFYFDEIRITPTCIEFTIMQNIKVKDPKPSFVTVYDYYDTDIMKTLTYSLECSTEPEPAQRQVRFWGEIQLSPELFASQPGCPLCESELPSDWLNKFCISFYVLTIKFRQNQRVKIYYNHKTGETLDMIVPYSLDESCDCQPDYNQKYVVFVNAVRSSQEEPRLHLLDTFLTFPFKRELMKELKTAECPNSD